MTLTHHQKTTTPITKQTAFLIVGAANLLLLDLVLTGSWWASTVVLMCAAAMSTIVWSQRLNHLFRRLPLSDRRYTLLKVAMIVALATFMLHSLAEPAAAQFYIQTENWLKGILAQAAGADVVIALAFNLLRGIFVIYLGIAIVKVVNAQREGDDWQTLAKTPLIIVLAVTSGDIIASFITTGAGGGAGG
ncbi:MAG: hypothetical protein AAFW75_28435 [Cyanobacteria bacterium J06636_16]